MNTSTQVVTESTIVAKISKQAYAQITPFHNVLFDTLFNAADERNAVYETTRQAIDECIVSQYGVTCPTYDQFKADRTALRVLSLERGLVDDQYVRKVYNAAVIGLYGALPLCMSKAAMIKREADAKLGKGKGCAKSKQVKAPSPIDDIGQFIAKYGTAKVLMECAKILATSKQTALDAKTIEAVAGHFSQKAA